MIPRSLHARLSIALLVLLALTGLVSVAWTLRTSRLHRWEMEQRVNRDLSAHIVARMHRELLDADGRVRSEGFQQLFHWLMMVNPRLECYLVDLDGRILSFDPALGDLPRRRIDVGPIRRLLAGRERLPLLGDDPRHLEGRKIFTAAPLPPEGRAVAYLYVILDGEELITATEELARSEVLRISIWACLAYLTLAAVAWVLLFRRLTRPLRQLAGRMERFAESLEAVPQGAGTGRGIGEVDRLEQSFLQLEARIREQIAELDRAEVRRREGVANLSHDLRTPLAALRGYLETLELKGSTLSAAEQANYIHAALRHSERLSKMIEELFALSKLREARLRPEIFSIAELVQDNVQRYRLGKEGKIDLRVDFDPEVPQVRGDLGLIERVLENLLENALRFTSPGGSVVVEIEHLQPQDRVAVRVRDTGCGIPADQLDRVFDRHFRGKPIPGASPVPDGSGLGLAIARRILELHDGEIDIESSSESGTCFVFSLPVARLEAERREIS